MVRLLQFLAFILFLRFVWRAVIRLMAGPEMSRVREGSPGERKSIYRGQMVRDPVCGVYIPEQGSLVERRSGETYHFCSEACRDGFLQGKVATK
jgi:YHS domain-containing protein